jgi:hypothetical protein
MDRKQESSAMVDSKRTPVSGAGRALAWIGGLSLTLLAGTTGCAERLADCVEVYANTGANRLHGYTMTTCADHCKTVTGWLDCYWDGSVFSITAAPVPDGNSRPLLTRSDELYDFPSASVTT